MVTRVIGWMAAMLLLLPTVVGAQRTYIDTDGKYINAHGGGILKYKNKYYWYGESRPDSTGGFQMGVSCYSSKDLQHWKNEGLVLAAEKTVGSPIEEGCIMERPKVIYNKKTKRFVMYFHLELKGQGYAAAQCGVAVSKSPIGPFVLLHHGRVNAGQIPMDLNEDLKDKVWDATLYKTWWTEAWYDAVADGMFVKKDLEGGQMARDMTLFVDEDGKAYHIYSSEENLTLQIAELSDDYTRHTGRYMRMMPAGHNEAPTIFKHEGMYWMIASGCTGWAPNKARMFSAPTIWGPWTQYDTPFKGEGAEKTFGSQGTYVFADRDGQLIFMADVWRPRNLMYSGYLWLPIHFDEKGKPYIERN